MPGWLDDDELKAKLAAVVKSQDAAGAFDEAKLPAWWDQHIAQANEDAYYSVLAALAARGFAASDLRRWPLGKSYQADLALYRLLVKGGVGEGAVTVPEELLARLDRLAQLDTLLLTDTQGDPLVPAGVAAGGPVGHGDMKRTGPNGDVTRTWVGGTPAWKVW
jgi:hypothetical protein